MLKDILKDILYIGEALEIKNYDHLVMGVGVPENLENASHSWGHGHGWGGHGGGIPTEPENR